MPPPAILDLAQLDLDHVVADREAIAAVNPHRYEFQLLDRVFHLDLEAQTFAGFVDLSLDDWWVRGHIPGRPLFPGVLMIESAAQLSSYAYKQYIPSDAFLGFAGVENVKFRGTAQPPARLLLVGRAVEAKPRRMITEVQGFIDRSMAFQARITGMAV